MTDRSIRIHEVTFRRDEQLVLESLTADIRPGAATAVVGPSGAGKSTLLALIAGFERPDAGTIENPFLAARTGVVLQSYALVRLLTAAENVELALQPTGLPPEEIRSRATEQLERFGLVGLADRRTDELSGGQQQRLAIARALVIRPELLIADELTSELDPLNRDAALREILGLRALGATVVLATHDESVAASCDAVIRVGDTREKLNEAERDRVADTVVLEQRRRIRAQREIVRTEQQRLDDLEHALHRLLQQRGGSHSEP